MTNDMAGDGADSKRLLGRLGAGALAFGAMAALSSKSAKAATAAAYDLDVLNFALNLEYLEAEYYVRAVTGQGLSAFTTSDGKTSLTNNSSSTVSVPSTTLVPFQTPAIGYWAEKIANDELSHVRFLIEGIPYYGGTPVQEPNIDLMASFNTLAQLAGLIPMGSPVGTFNPFASELGFLIGAYIFEDVGVTAYAGAAGALTNPDIISYGSSILAVEAMHAGLIRSYLSEIGGGKVTNAISAVRQLVSNVQDNGTDLSGMLDSAGNPGSAFNFVNTDYNGQVFRRTPQQVLNVVYGASGTGVTGGGFFPNGVNGALTVT